MLSQSYNNLAQATTPFYTVSKAKLVKQLAQWKRYLPEVIPHYAVKCNTDPMLLKWCTEYYPEMGFDCASLAEIDAALPLTNRIVYAQPCKRIVEISEAQARGIDLTVVDSVEEVEKLSEAGWTGRVLVRLLVKDKGSKQPFGMKFGAPMEWLDSIYTKARELHINMVGFSFHVGSECTTPKQYSSAIKMCASAAEVAKTYFFATRIVDIGGGYIPVEASFAEIAACVNSARLKYFGSADYVEWIAEPGRFLATTTHTLYVSVIGKKPVWPAPETQNDPKYRLTVDESIYGAFSNIPGDHQKPTLELLREDTASLAPRPTIVFGRTCDSADCLGKDLLLPEAEVGDIFRIKRMGAYTVVTATEFNGFAMASKVYVEEEEETQSSGSNSPSLEEIVEDDCFSDSLGKGKKEVVLHDEIVFF